VIGLSFRLREESGISGLFFVSGIPQKSISRTTKGMKTTFKTLFLVMALLSVLAVACGSEDDAPKEDENSDLVLITHSSFSFDEDLIAKFEADNDATVTILEKSDGGAMLTSVILTKDNPEGDLVFGVDNTFLSRALDNDIFQSYKAAGIDNVDDGFHVDDDLATPIDFGYVNFNYDIAALEEAGLAPPTSLDELTDPKWKGLVVVQNPASSTPGLAFLLTTIAYFGEDDYLDWWQAMRDNDIVVTDGWDTAYYTNFTLYGGSQPIVLSYSTSPAFEQLYAEPPRDDAPTGNILPAGAVFRQIEYAGVLKNAKNPNLAGKFIDFLLSAEAQAAFPDYMGVFPVNTEASVTEAFTTFGSVDVAVAEISGDDIAENRDEWINDWTNAVLR
jgi:thiamine transport system substrate-binding protein